MPIYVWITEACRRDAERHNFLEELERLKQRTERWQVTSHFEKFAEPYLKKNLGRKGRLMIQESRQGDDTVLVFGRLLIKGDRSYDEFCKIPATRQPLLGLDPRELQNFLRSIQAAPKPPEPRPDELETAALNAHLPPESGHEGTFLESAEWVQLVSGQPFASRLSSLFNSVSSLLDTRSLPLQGQTPYRDGVSVLFRYLPEARVWYLAAPLSETDPGSDRHRSDLDPSTPLSELRRRALRSYPALVALDSELWIQVQNSSLANLSLSPEEQEVLESVRLAQAGAPRYPLFINGRPGSGKSTVLHYLFADHLYHHLKSQPRLTHPPLYLTYGEGLLNQARRGVKDLLERGYALTGAATIDGDFERAFSSYRRFLTAHLSPDLQEYFRPENWVGFARFRRAYGAFAKTHNRQEVRALPAATAWHAIRTYIKGYQAGGELSPSEYEELPASRRSLTLEQYQSIFEQVWSSWYRVTCEREGWWDDQDLTWRILEQGLDLARYPAVFCDEAQDFTRIELQVLQNLCLYSRRRLEPHQLSAVPFAFAGDPFQTLNPTGFSWDAMQANFHETILDRAGARLRFNFRELTYNYRSRPEIVKLTNLVHLLRGVLLSLPGLSPQVAWSSEGGGSPLWCDWADPLFRETLRGQEEVVILVPCQEDEEGEYVAQDPFLKSFALEDGRVRRNILSPARAKGLEFERVVVYGFGDRAAGMLPDLIEQIKAGGNEDSQRNLPWEYFLSQLYVAVSRARKRLFIVDSEEGLNGLWSFARQSSHWNGLLGKYRDAHRWKAEDVTGLVKATAESWLDDRDDPGRLAQALELQAEDGQDAYIFRLAAQNYRSASLPEKAFACEAMALELEGDYAAAALAYGQANLLEDEDRCHWLARDWNALALPRPLDRGRADYRLAAEVARSRIATAEGLRQLVDKLQWQRRRSSYAAEGRLQMDTRPAWKAFFEVQCRRLAEQFADALEGFCATGESARPSGLSDLLLALDRLESDLGITLGRLESVRQLLCLDGRTREAAQEWEGAESRWWLRAKALETAYPESLEYLARLGDQTSIVAAHQAQGHWPAQAELHAALLRAYLDQDQTEPLLQRLWESPSLGEVARLVEHQRHRSRDLAELIPLIVRAVIAAGQWNRLVGWLEQGTVGEAQLDACLSLLRSDRSARMKLGLRLLARSEQLSKAAHGDQNLVRDVVQSDLKTRAVEISAEEEGAFLERVGIWRDVLPFYEKFLGRRGAIGHAARVRWLICKSRLAAASKDPDVQKRHEGEHKSRRDEWGISESELRAAPEYPLLPILDLASCVPVLASQDSAIPPNPVETDIQADAKTRPEPTSEGGEERQTESMTQAVITDELTTVGAPASATPGGQPEGSGGAAEPVEMVASEPLTRPGSAAANSTEVRLHIGDRPLRVDYQPQKRRLRLTIGEDTVTVDARSVRSEDVEVESVENRYRLPEWGLEIGLTSAVESTLVYLYGAQELPLVGFALPG